MNNAAERLRSSQFLSTFQKRTLDEALAAERRATVERIRAALPDAVLVGRYGAETLTLTNLEPYRVAVQDVVDSVYDILDAEAER